MADYCRVQWGREAVLASFRRLDEFQQPWQPAPQLLAVQIWSEVANPPRKLGASGRTPVSPTENGLRVRKSRHGLQRVRPSVPRTKFLQSLLQWVYGGRHSFLGVLPFRGWVQVAPGDLVCRLESAAANQAS